MNKILITLLGTSLLAGALYAGQNTSIKNEKELTMSKSGVELFFERYAQNDPNGGG